MTPNWPVLELIHCILCIFKGIAVHNDLVYDVSSCENHISDGGAVIFANSRLVHTSDILKPVDRYGQIKGMHISASRYIEQLKYQLYSIGSDLVGISYKPLFSSLCPSAKSMKIIPSSHVTALSGTGLVHCAPAHGEEDYVAFRSLGLFSNTANMLCHVDEKGTFLPEIANVVGEEAAATLIGKDVMVTGNAAMLELLKKEQKAVKIEKIKHRYPYDWKTNEPVIVTYDSFLRRYFPNLHFNRATSQWFANLDGIKEDALSALDAVSFYPQLCKALVSRLFYSLIIFIRLEKPVIALNHSFNRVPSGVFRDSVSGESQFLLYITFRQGKSS